VSETRPWVRVACYALVRDGEGRVLLCRISSGEHDGGRWTLPGGGIEFGEGLAAGCRREVREETGLEVELGTVAEAHAELVETGRGQQHAVRIVYEARSSGGELMNEVDGSTDCCEYFSLGEIEGMPIVPLVRRALGLAGRAGSAVEQQR